MKGSGEQCRGRIDSHLAIDAGFSGRVGRGARVRLFIQPNLLSNPGLAICQSGSPLLQSAAGIRSDLRPRGAFPFKTGNLIGRSLTTAWHGSCSMGGMEFQAAVNQPPAVKPGHGGIVANLRHLSVIEYEVTSPRSRAVMTGLLKAEESFVEGITGSWLSIVS